MNGRGSDELAAGYEALRAEAVGSLTSDTPRGLALFLAQGLPAWIRASVPPPAPRPVVPAGERSVAPGLAAEVVRVLTEMALGCRSGLATA